MFSNKAPSKIFIEQDQLFTKKVIMEDSDDFLMIEIKQVYFNARIFIPKPCVILEGHRYYLFFNEEYDEALEEKFQFYYQNSSLFSNSYLIYKNKQYTLLSGSVEIINDFPDNLHIEIKGAIENNGDKKEVLLQLSPTKVSNKNGRNKIEGNPESDFKRIIHSPEKKRKSTGKSFKDIEIRDFVKFPVWVWGLENEGDDTSDETWLTPWMSTGVPNENFVTVVDLTIGENSYKAIADVNWIENNTYLEIFSIDAEITQNDFVSLQELSSKGVLTDCAVTLFGITYHFHSTRHFTFPVMAYRSG